MKITWLGHSCFSLESDGYQIVIDPYAGVAGYLPLRTQAHAVYCSHEHFDHNYRDGVELLPERKSPFSAEEIASFHDGERGALRGTNTIRCFTAEGKTVCHLGDLGHLLDEAQIRAIGRPDVLLIPVGGVFTVDAADARRVVEQLRPGCVVPMHYHHAPYGLEQVEGVEPFLKLFRPEEICTLTGVSFETEGVLSPVLVPVWSGK